jgi:hypothetical protein
MMGAVYGMYEFIHIGLFYCMIWSLTTSKLLSNALPSADRVSRLVGLGFHLHLAAAYTASGFAKGIGKQWQYGEALWRSIYRSDSTGTRIFDFSIVHQWPILLQVTCIAVFTFEALYWLTLFRRPRGLVVCVIILMHLGIMIALGLWLFGAAMIVLNMFVFAQGRRLDSQVDSDGSLLQAIGLVPIPLDATESLNGLAKSESG